MAIIRSIEEIDISKGILVDSNMWVFKDDATVTNPDRINNASNQRRIQAERNYADTLSDLLYVSLTDVYVTPDIISEFTNVRLKNAFEAWQKKNHLTDQSFKHDFREKKVPEYVSTYQDIIGDLEEYFSLENFHVLDTTNLILTETVGHLHTDVLDFNDEIILRQAITNRLPIMTDDRDYRKIDGNFSIYTIH